MEQPREDLAQLSDAELVWRRMLLEHMQRIDGHLADMQSVFSPRRRLPDQELAAIAKALQAELKKRTDAKSGH